MQYLEQTTAAQLLHIPRNTDAPASAESVAFVITSTVDVKTVFNAEVIDLATSDRYYRIALALPEGVTKGEYEYKLTESDGDLATGILIVGEPGGNVKEYEKTIEYEQY